MSFPAVVMNSNASFSLLDDRGVYSCIYTAVKLVNNDAYRICDSNRPGEVIRHGLLCRRERRELKEGFLPDRSIEAVIFEIRGSSDMSRSNLAQNFWNYA